MSSSLLLSPMVTQARAWDPMPSSCPLYDGCGYYYTGFGGNIDAHPGSQIDLRNNSNPGHGNWDNEYSAFANDGRSCSIRLYQGYGYTGGYWTFPIGTALGSLGSVGMGNNVSSWKFCP